MDSQETPQREEEVRTTHSFAIRMFLLFMIMITMMVWGNLYQSISHGESGLHFERLSSKVLLVVLLNTDPDAVHAR